MKYPNKYENKLPIEMFENNKIITIGEVSMLISFDIIEEQTSTIYFKPDYYIVGKNNFDYIPKRKKNANYDYRVSQSFKNHESIDYAIRYAYYIYKLENQEPKGIKIAVEKIGEHISPINYIILGIRMVWAILDFTPQQDINYNVKAEILTLPNAPKLPLYDTELNPNTALRENPVLNKKKLLKGISYTNEETNKRFNNKFLQI